MTPNDDTPDPADGKTIFLKPGQSMPEPDPVPAPANKDPVADDAAEAAEDAWFRAGEVAADPPAAPPADQAAEPPAAQGWASAPEPAQDWPSAPIERTVYAPPPGADLSRPADTSAARAPPAATRTGVAPGDTLNDIYEVRRFIARGGMGEVYEGVNVMTDERVAIKVILPHLAADKNVQDMFRREARTLTRLSDPALVQYRVLAQEPKLGVFYIVTEFIDGQSLADVIGKVRPSVEELRGLIRRLAMGLRTAHDLGAIHRDLSPDNVLLPQGRLAMAKVIDFGIAKDLDASTGTIIGDGFAGKLGYVAPEQFGDYGRQIGPWTDVYSLALVILAVAAGRAPDMGATLVDAIDRRRKGPDLSAVAEPLRPVLSRMLAPDPVNRLQSMDAVIAALDEPVAAGPAQRGRAQGPKPPAPGGPPKALIMGGAAALGVMAVLGLVAALLLNKPKPPAAASDQAAASSVAAGAPNLASYQQAAEQAIGATPCAWYEVEGMAPAAGGVNVTLTGVSGNPGSAQAFKDSVQKAAGGTVTVTEDKVALIASSACAALDAARQFRAPPATAGQWIKPLQSEFRTGVKRPECGNDPAQALTPIDIAGASEPGEDDTVIGWDSTGKVQTLYTGAAQFDAFRASLAGTPNANVFEVTPTGRRLNLCADVGDQGILVIRGAKPSSLGLPGLASHGLKSGPPPPDFPARFDAAAQANGWRTQMAWYRVSAG